MDENDHWGYRAVWPARPKYVREARDFVSARLRRHHLDDLVPDAQLVVSELVTNAVVHAGTPFSVSLELLDDCVELVIGDGSPGELVARLPEPLALGGRGLQVVDECSASWGVRRAPGGGKAVWATFAT